MDDFDITLWLLIIIWISREIRAWLIFMRKN